MRLVLLLLLPFALRAADPPKRDSLRPVHAGVAIMALGQFADWAVSWKQPEANSLLAEPDGPYAGRFYRRATYCKIGVTGGLAAMTYFIAWKWPKDRRLLAWVNAGIGWALTGVAVSNVVRNPYYR